MKKLLILLCTLSCSTSYPMFAGLFGGAPSSTKPPIKNPQAPATVAAPKPAPNQVSKPAAAASTSTQMQSSTSSSAPVVAQSQSIIPASAPRQGSGQANIPAALDIPPNAPVWILNNNVTCNPAINANSNNVQNQNVSQEASQMNHQITYQYVINEIKNVIHEKSDAARQHFISIKEWIESNKKKVILMCAGAGYGALLAALIRTNWRINDRNNWSYWRYDESLEELMQFPQKELAQSLVFAIQRRYTTEKQFADFIQPLMHFMRDVEQEKKWLKNYIRAGKWIMRLGIHYILPINQRKIDQAEKLLLRVLFFEHVFLSWAAEFKMEQNTKTA